MESYQRSYPYFCQLQILHDIEYLSSAALSNVDVDRLIDKRIQRTLPDFDIREQMISSQRVALEIIGLPSSAGKTWFLLANEAKLKKRFDLASSALLHSKRFDELVSSIEQAKLLHEKGDVYSAIELLTYTQSLLDTYKSSNQAKESLSLWKAEILISLGQWLQQTSSQKSSVVTSYFKKAAESQGGNEKAYFFLASYLDKVLQLSLKEPSVEPEATPQIGSKRSTRLQQLCDSIFTQQSLTVYSSTMQNYAAAVIHGHEYIFQSLPRFVTLWMNYSALWYSQMLSQEDQKKGQLAMQFMRWMEAWISKVPAYKWFTVLPQVVSRICQKDSHFDFVAKVLEIVLVNYPRQAVWYVGVLVTYSQIDRKKRALEVIKLALKAMTAENRDLINLSLNVFAQFLRLCEQTVDSTSLKIKMSKYFSSLHRAAPYDVLVPTQSALTPSLPESHGNDFRHNFNAFGSTFITISRFDDEIEIMRSKEKPKKIGILGSDGHKYYFLCKAEKKGDMRKNSRMIELASMINRLLNKDSSSRFRNLNMKTFAVIPFEERCGIIEWVPQTSGLRHTIERTIRNEGNTVFSKEEVKAVYNTSTSRLIAFRTLLQLIPPQLHRWFVHNFHSASSWMEARLKFTRSVAVWSMVGYLVGLGDRHGDNILLDQTTGECMHVDFDCLFDAGKFLNEPEVVPFRLTQNLVDSMGITGVEGNFRVSAEKTLKVLRGNRDLLMNVLDSFVHDPLVEWTSANLDSKLIMSTIDNRLKGKFSSESLPLSVEGQVQLLIEEATSPDNLSRMYIWWTPWM
jgi:serine/threonine-protein kinase ATR